MGVLDWKGGYVPKAAGAAIASYILSDVAAKLIWKNISKRPPEDFGRKFAQRWLPHHHEIGSSMFVIGALGHTKGWSPLAVGAGLGMVGSDFADWVKQESRIFTPQRDLADLFNVRALNDTYCLTSYDIPDWVPREWQYEFIAHLLQKIVTEPTFNSKTLEWIPAGRDHPAVIAQARKIVSDAGLDGRNKPAVAKAVQQWVQNNIRYVYDTRGRDIYVHPYRMLEWKTGDCDCHSLLVSSLLESLGISTVLVMVGQVRPEVFNHILAGAVIDNQIIPLETTIKAPFGWQPQYLRRAIIRIP